MWRYVALIGSVVTLLWVFVSYKLGFYATHGIYNKLNSRGRTAIAAVVSFALIGLSNYAAWPAYTPPIQNWWVMILCGVVMFAVIFVPMLKSEDFSGWFFAIGIIGASSLIGTGAMKLFDNNPYQVEKGQVVAHDFSPAHSSISCVKVCSTKHHPDTWSILVRDCDSADACHEGWISFDEDVFATWPVGSYYPQLQ